MARRLKSSLLLPFFLALLTPIFNALPGLQKQWPVAYDGWIRWVLTLALLSGWVLGVWVEASENVVALWYALLAGMMLIRLKLFR